MDSERVAALWRRGQEGFPRAYPVAQFPSPPLLVYLAALVGRSATSGDTATTFDAIGRVAFAAWGYDELRYGVNAFRRVLGAVVLVSVALGLADDL